jgi:hypothetical protein
MSEAAIEQYIKTAPVSQIKKFARLLAERQNRIETDRAIRRAQADIKAGRVISSEDLHASLKTEFGII